MSSLLGFLLLFSFSLLTYHLLFILALYITARSAMHVIY